MKKSHSNTFRRKIHKIGKSILIHFLKIIIFEYPILYYAKWYKKGVKTRFETLRYYKFKRWEEYEMRSDDVRRYRISLEVIQPLFYIVPPIIAILLTLIYQIKSPFITIYHLLFYIYWLVISVKARIFFKDEIIGCTKYESFVENNQDAMRSGIGAKLKFSKLDLMLLNLDMLTSEEFDERYGIP